MGIYKNHSFFKSLGPYTTINIKSLSGATIISFCFVLILKKVRSLEGSKSRTILLAFCVS